MKKLLYLLVFLCTLPVFADFQAGQTVRVVYNGKVLSVDNSSLDAGASVVLWTETKTNSQRWTLVDNGKGGFNLVNVYSGHYLGYASLANNAAITQIGKSTAVSRGAWELVPDEAQEGKYKLYASTTRRFCLSAAKELKDGSAVTLVASSTADAERTAFTVEESEASPNQLTAEIREDMMHRWMDKYYHKANTGHVIGKGGWWGDAEMFEVVLDAYETTGLQEYATMFDELYKNFCSRNGTDWSGNSYNDDIAWMCIACVRAYLLTGNTDYRTKAKSNFDTMYKRANAYGDNTLIWCQGKTGTNSCINGPASVAACYLAIATGLESYYTKAKKTYAGERNILFAFNNGKFTGQVYDSYSTTEKKVSNTWSSTYNQGTCLGAAVMLYDHFGDEMYKDDADAIVTWTKNNLANSNGIIKVCQTSTGDLTGFKGILMRYFRRYAADLGRPENYDWLARNAFHAWNNRNSAGISMSAWLHKTPENFNYSDGGDFSNDGVGAFTALSAAYNAHLGVHDTHNAYDTIEAEDFNFLRGIQVTEDEGATVVGPMTNSTYVGFRNVDFGKQAASHIQIRMFKKSATSKVMVYADSPSTSGTLIASISPEENSQWSDITVPLYTPIEGCHDIYLVATGSTRVELLSVDKFSFLSQTTMYHDLTNNGGLLTTSISGIEDLVLLTDDHASTGISGATEEGDAWIQYQSTEPIHLSAYSIYSGLVNKADPQGWLLQGSNEGEMWTTLDTQTEVTFETRGQQMLIPVQTEQSYTYYRLLFPEMTAGASIALAEWQLIGTSLAESDITHDGGSAETSYTTYIYHALGQYLLQSYSVSFGSPVSWTLYGSANGKNWTVLDQQADQSYYPGTHTNAYNVNATTGYSHYKFELQDGTENNADEADAQSFQVNLFGALDFGRFYPDVTQFASAITNDGENAQELFDKNGSTYSTVTGTAETCPSWDIRLPFATRVIAYSLIASNNVDLNPQDVVLYGIDDETGELYTLSSKSVNLTMRGQRSTNTVSSSRTFNHLRLDAKRVANDGLTASLAELEIYTTTAVDDATLVPAVASIKASVDPVSLTEGVEKLIDLGRLSRYRAVFDSSISFTITYDEAQAITAYSLTTSKDEPTRDPSSWILEGSTDGKLWVPLDSRQNELFSHRYSTQFYFCNSEETAYTQYRLTVNAVNGGTQLQLGEIQLFKGDNLSGIEAVPAVESTIGQIGLFDLSGRKLSQGQLLTRGVYIQHGRKVVVR